ncbi:hypothetical protein [Actinoallomurus sp. NPDC052274]|uniref:helix-turn-helix transcriptional regulator n=1 Tax=Actinoallomurus sp. NPDC052274 TaxID=3155420 RepID=UPI00343441FB
MDDQTVTSCHLRTQSLDEWITRLEFVELARASGVGPASVATAKRWARMGIGPRPRKFGPRLVRYKKAEVMTWLRVGKAA